MEKICVEDLYTKCKYCNKEIKIFDECFYKGYNNYDWNLITDYIFCSVDCLSEAFNKNKGE